MILLVIAAIFCLLASGYLIFIEPAKKHIQEKSTILASLVVGTCVKTYAGDIGTIHAINGKHLTIFFNDGNRKIILPEQVAAIIHD